MLLGRVSIWQHISYLMTRPNGDNGVPLGIPYDTPYGMMGCPWVSEYE